MAETTQNKIENLEYQLRTVKSLDRLRDLMMSMKKSTDLSEVIRVIFEEAIQLGFGAMACDLVIIDQKTSSSEFWVSGEQNDQVIHFTIPELKLKHYQEALLAWRKRRKLRAVELKGNACKAYMKKLSEAIPQNKSSAKIIKIVRGLRSIHHTEAYMKYGFFRVAGDSFLTKEAEGVLKNFAKVFEQTYTRFLDLQKAEAQAREAEIEAALERVRAVAMGMNEPTDMIDVCRIISEQLQVLKVENIRNVQTAIINDEKGTYLNYEFFTQYNTTSIIEVKSNLHPKVLEFVNSIKKSKDAFFTTQFKGKDLEEWIAYRRKTNQNADPILEKAKSVHYYFYSIGPGALGLSTYVPLNSTQLDVFRRFHNVFMLAYNRFMDIKKAEAQAREAQIEAALERVRSASMAMHESKDLFKIVNVVLQEMAGLDLSMSSVIIHEFRNESKDMYFWAAAPGMEYPEIVHLPYIKSQYFSRFIQALENSETFFSDQIAKRETLSNWRHYFKHNQVPAERQKYLLSIPGMSRSCTLHNNTAMTMMRYDTIPFDEAENGILLRFGQVFQQSYQRFLDLQKAEAQAREAEIQLALERVRAASMAMHESSDLLEVARIIFQQLNELGIPAHAAYIYENMTDREAVHCWVAANGQLYPEQIHFPFINNRIFIETFEALDNGEDFRTGWLSKREKDQLFKHNFKNSNLVVPIERQNFIFASEGLTWSTAFLKNTALTAHTYTKMAFSEEQNDIIKRLGAAFEQAYTRFLDLKKAEAQAREALIEASLERVRAASMAMHQSEELPNVALTMLDEIELLGVPLFGAGVSIVNDDNNTHRLYFADNSAKTDKKTLLITGDIPLNVFWLTREHMKLHDQGHTEISFELKGKKLAAWIEWVRKYMSKERADRLQAADLKKVYVYNIAFYGRSVITISSLMQFSAEHWSILRRMAKTFAMSYKRFLDLQRAEAQTRESQIEASLERVRASSMAMHQSEGLLEVIKVVFEQLVDLGIKFTNVSFGQSNQKDDYRFWASTKGHPDPVHLQVPYLKHPMLERLARARAEGMTFLADTLTPSQNKKWVQHLRQYASIDYITDDSWDELCKRPYARSLVIMPSIFLVIDNYRGIPFSAEHNQILQRFAKVFEQAYTRFLDLQKAEAQARESKIEAALERVRASTMAMHKSTELAEVAGIVFQQLNNLGLVNEGDRFNFGIINELTGVDTVWITELGGAVMSGSFEVPLFGFAPFHDLYKRWINLPQGERKGNIVAHKHTGQDLVDFITYVVKHTDFAMDPSAQQYLNEMPVIQWNTYDALFSHGTLTVQGPHDLDAESQDILIRFAKVFEQTYTRFLDLQKAEAQTREAQIEASLEKIRARAMAMQKSDELREVVGLVSEELNISLENTICIIMNFDWQSMEIEWWSTGFNVDNLPESYKIPIRDTIKDHPLIRHYQEAVQKGISYNVYKLEGEIKRSWDNYIFEHSDLKKIPLETQNWMRSYEGVICNEAFMSHGVLEVDGPEQLSDDKAEVLQRFAKVVDLTYKRIEDLQQAEARAVEAVRQASLDRVRGEIASMRSVEDLSRITPLIWKELTALEVPFTRCGVMIMDEKQHKIQSHLATPDGQTLGIFDIPYDSQEIATRALPKWRKGEIYKDHWDREQFTKFMHRLLQSGQIKNPESYQGSDAPPESLDLHFVPFKQGMLYVGNTSPLTEDEIDLVQSLADAFSIAYARYEDFTHLEQALGELKSTQTQLIHSEKMASLGELTAGIAHEIQNPLNFVNNFSEVSEDLIEEMKEELKDGNDEEVRAISQDLLQNLEKIRHHGQRASSIVKGMLEHSRTGSPTKELTDLNALADEYVRLAYHGLRAKDQSFNADFRTELDENLPKVKVISQDVGRVILNIINNAFYAVSSRAKSSGNENYKPEVLVSTKLNDKKVEIVIQDNGDGIPQSNMDKIFQPFFTTKPTGQGTGLGLSLSYDIITKGHDGHLEVESDEGIGTRFIIEIPLTT